MKRAKSVKQKAIGRPRAGIRPLIGFRTDDATRAAIVKWAETQPDVPSLSEAIRRLVELGLTVKGRPKQPAAARVKRANEIAGKQLDQMADKSAPAEEQASRKRNLLKGPEEFRDVRIDRPKKRK
jgi:hypothetical protein